MRRDPAGLEQFFQNIKHLNGLLKSGTPITYEMFKKDTGGIIPRGDTIKNQNTSLFRARVISEKELVGGLTKANFSYPEPCTKDGRCNIKGYPALYASMNFECAILEILLSATRQNEPWPRQIYIAEWSFPKPVSIEFFDFSHKVTIQDLALSHEAVNQANMYLKFLRSCFVSENAYDFTSKFSHDLLVLGHHYKEFHIANEESFSEAEKLRIIEMMRKKTSPVDLLIYPSVVTNGHLDNLAVSPRLIAENKLQLIRVIKLDILSTEEDLEREHIAWSVNPEIGIVKEEPEHEILWKCRTKADIDFLKRKNFLR